MNIKKLVSDGDAGVKYATVTLSYEECRDLANGLYELCDSDPDKCKKYRNLQTKCQKLSELVKSGWITSHPDPELGE